ncbi:hypothetical protein [Methylopila sp. 73B]|uniref:hypothetical protein n=1 Tax=Methylopila sp. 73B TaxID=1120792 RepID=UPI0018CC69E2|nr:hypothetical protein [Methylopila sp. 73B]
MSFRDRMDAAEDAGAELQTIAEALRHLNERIDGIFRTVPEAAALDSEDFDLLDVAGRVSKLGSKLISDVDSAREDAMERRRQPAEVW